MVETGTNMFLKAFLLHKTMFYLNCANHNFGRLVLSVHDTDELKWTLMT